MSNEQSGIESEKPDVASEQAKVECPECTRDDGTHRRDCFIGICYEADAYRALSDDQAKRIETLEAACGAAIAYDAAIQTSVILGRVQPLEGGGGSTQDDRLDELYDDWITKARAALQEVE